jgi:hypothetical protein
MSTVLTLDQDFFQRLQRSIQQSENKSSFSPCCCTCRNEGMVRAHFTARKSNLAADSYTFSAGRRVRQVRSSGRSEHCLLIDGAGANVSLSFDRYLPSHASVRWENIIGSVHQENPLLHYLVRWRWDWVHFGPFVPVLDNRRVWSIRTGNDRRKPAPISRTLYFLRRWRCSLNWRSQAENTIFH